MTFTRRTFMETTCALSAGLVFGSLAHASTKVPEKWDETCSLLIIGTGFAGLGAALESHYLGMKDILVVDKMPSAGGNSIINGGAIALGHPLGCTGARLIVTLMHNLKRTGGKIGLATLCIGGGQAMAALIEMQ